MAKQSKWSGSDKAIKATQVAFELEQRLVRQIHEMAAKAGLTPSSQIRKLVGLPFSEPKRPRLSVSLSPADCKALGKQYNMDPEDVLEIKRRMMQALIEQLET